MPSETPVVVFSTPCIAAASCRDFYVDVWRTQATAREVRMTAEAQVAQARRIRGKVAALSVVLESGVGIPDAQARAALDAAIVQIAPHTKAGALALLATGFSGAIIRSLYVAVNQFSRPPYPMRITSTVAEACTFLARHMEPGVDLLDVVRAAETAPVR